jgi:serine/threonine-protein kinase
MATAGLNAPAPDTLIAGKYKVGQVLASGGMGVVVEAEHATLGQRVAIKFLLPEAAGQTEFVERFLREARAAAGLQSDHVVRVFDMGTDEEGRPFMVMERLSGSDLSNEMEARGQLPVGEAVGYLVQALDAIVEAHGMGIVHRDLKPSNLFLVSKSDGSRRVKVLDFGISKVSPIGSAPEAALTSTKSMLGSPGYMSPEQVRSTRNVDARTDVWALGVILYEMLSGTSAFEGETLGDIFAKIREDDLPPIRVRRPDVPEGLASVLHECLQRDRNNRVPDAATLRARLAPFAGQRDQGALGDAAPASVHREALAAAATMAAPSSGNPALRPPGETLATWTGAAAARRKSRLVWVGGAAAALAGAVGVWLLMRTPSGGAGSPAQTSALTATAPSSTAEVPTSPSATASAALPVVTPSETATLGATAQHTASAAPVVTAPPPRPTATTLAPPPTDSPPTKKKKKDTLGL